MEMRITIPREVIKHLGDKDTQLVIIQDKNERDFWIDGTLVFTVAFYDRGKDA